MVLCIPSLGEDTGSHTILAKRSRYFIDKQSLPPSKTI